MEFGAAELHGSPFETVGVSIGLKAHEAGPEDAGDELPKAVEALGIEQGADDFGVGKGCMEEVANSAFETT